MIGRLISSLFIAAILAAILFGVITSVFPQTFMVLEPVLCRDYEKMEIESRPAGGSEFTINASCTGDGERKLDDITLYGTMFLVYLVPLWALLWLNAATARKPKIQVQTVGSTVQPVNWSRAGGGPSFSVTVNADSKLAAETAALVKEALKDGVITSEEYDQIFAKVNRIVDTGGDAQMKSLTERLKELQDAYAQNLITKDEYDTKRHEILDKA